MSKAQAAVSTSAEELLVQLQSLRDAGDKLSEGYEAIPDPNWIRLLPEKHRVPVLDHYGLTETIFAIGEHVDHYKPDLDIIGQPPNGITVELTEVEGISDPELTVGQIRIHSPNLFLGYLGEPLARKRYFDTGDLGIRDAAGNIILKGRLDHGVKATSGLWLFPQAVEQLLVNRSDIADAHVRSEYDQYDRGILRSQVVPANPETVDEDWLTTLKQDIEGQLGPDYEAVEIEIVSAISRTALKISSNGIFQDSQ